MRPGGIMGAVLMLAASWSCTGPETPGGSADASPTGEVDGTTGEMPDAASPDARPDQVAPAPRDALRSPPEGGMRSVHYRCMHGTTVHLGSLARRR